MLVEIVVWTKLPIHKFFACYSNIPDYFRSGSIGVCGGRRCPSGNVA
jgi:hypothetical protein